MTEIILPKLKFVQSPNFSNRSVPVDLIVVHDCEGSYAGSVSWFSQAQSQVSAHYVLKEDGSEATQMEFRISAVPRPNSSVCGESHTSLSLDQSRNQKN